jgi:hypothetical protein
MALVPTLNLRQFRDFDGQMTLQQMFLEGGVVPVWNDVPVVDFNDADEVRRREAEQARQKQAASLKKGADIGR